MNSTRNCNGINLQKIKQKAKKKQNKIFPVDHEVKVTS